MTREQAISIIRSGKFFTVEFIKRTTGETRILNGRTGVKKHLHGREPVRMNFTDQALIPVWDRQLGEYRSIPKEGIIKLNGKKVRR